MRMDNKLYPETKIVAFLFFFFLSIHAKFRYLYINRSISHNIQCSSSSPVIINRIFPGCMTKRRSPSTPPLTKWPTGLICAYKVKGAQSTITLKKYIFLNVFEFLCVRAGRKCVPIYENVCVNITLLSYA